MNKFFNKRVNLKKCEIIIKYLIKYLIAYLNKIMILNIIYKKL